MKTKTKKHEEFMPINLTVDIPRMGWESFVTRPEELAEPDLDIMDALAGMYVLETAPLQVFLASKALFEIHHHMFIQREAKMGRRYTPRVWAWLPSSARREIYRNVGLSLGYDF